MGKSRRGKAEESIQKYGDPSYQGSQQLTKSFGQRAGQARDIYYGAPSPGPWGEPARAAGAKPRGARQRAPIDLGKDSSTGVYSQGAQGAGGNSQSIVKGLIGGRPLNIETLKSIEPQLSQHGMSLRWNARGTGADIILPDGTEIDFVGGMEGPEGSRTFQWDATGETVGGAGQGPGGVAGGAIRDYGEILNRYRQFADTGGYSPGDISNIRSRALSPVRAVYSDVNRAVDRSRSLTGDYAPGYAATKAKVGREQAYTTADATTNVEAALAQMTQQGKLAGMGGMASLYGTTPGLANMFGNQALAAGGQQLQAQSLQNQMGLGMIGSQMQAGQQPGRFGEIMGGLGQIGGMLYPWSRLGGGG